MKVTLAKADAVTATADLLAVPVFAGTELGPGAEDAVAALGAPVAPLLEATGVFTEVIAWPPVYWPAVAQWDNFGEVIRRADLVRFSVNSVFIALFTRGEVLPSTLDPDFGLTLQESASQHYTLVLMTWVGGIFLPLIIGYQIWNYYVFRERIRPDDGGLDRGY